MRRGARGRLSNCGSTRRSPAGGIGGVIHYNWLWVMLLGVEPAFRGQGVGARLLAEAESHARDKGAVGAHLDTFGYQAPGFYERRGYVEAHRLPGLSPQEDRIFLTKRFEASPRGG